ncbi:glycoside hydrolase family 16 protein [Chitinophaga sp. NPDC101104]|uniref:glycoside hydrolase family 16 protein n=1 Tax=Chitinophaga sp. NPDC101104 TaxID=3390561 RepID=UPI003D08E2D8
MKTIHFLPVVLIGLQIFACGGKNNDPAPPPYIPPTPVDKNWQFEATPVWADEFDYNGLPDPAKWTYDLGGGGWGNNELQYYTDKPANAQVANGMLSVIARKEKMDNRDYTSARLVSKGRGDFLYGRFEIKAKLPAGKGTWPAIWMLPTDWAYGDWPKSGEIDIMEHVGYDPNRVHMSVHTEAYNHSIGTQKTAATTVDKAIGEFHVYRVDWTPYAIRGYIDGSLLFTFTNESKGYKTWPFDKKFHFLLNIAVGGNWGGQQGIDDSVFPATLEIDYVRAYKMIDK